MPCNRIKLGRFHVH